MKSGHVHGLLPVVAALLGNALVTVIKAVAAFISGSSALFGEAVHSFADTLNQALLLIGIVRSRKKPDHAFHYGYGSERFFWALISACGVFFIGAGVTIYHGLHSILYAEEVTITPIIFVVLAVSLVIETITLAAAVREIRRRHPQSSWKERIDEADPATLAVLLEDGVAVLGVMVASVAVWLSYLTGNALWDALGSLVIGILLAIVAVSLIVKNRSYLIGRSIPEDEREAILALLDTEPAIERVIDFKSEVLDIGVYRIKCEIEFNGPALFDEAYQQESLRGTYDEVKDDYEAFKKFCVDYADRIPRLMGRKIDEIEQAIRQRYPSVRHIDIEVN